MRKTHIHFWRPSPIESMYGLFNSIYHKKILNAGTYTSPWMVLGVDIPLKSKRLNFSPEILEKKHPLTYQDPV